MLAIAPAEKEELDDPGDSDHVGEVPPEPAPGPVVAAEPEGVREGASCDGRLGVPLVEHAGKVRRGHLSKTSRFAEKAGSKRLLKFVGAGS